jgi:N-acyl-D-amino-acid deacylase
MNLDFRAWGAAVVLMSVLVVAWAYPRAASPESVLFRNASVLDGTGGPAFKADVLVDRGRIASVGEVSDRPAGARVIEATGLALAPGFIDVHSHLDFQLPYQPLAENMVRQGVTTIVGGQCGFALAPRGARASMLAGYLAALGVESQKMDFTTLADYFAELEKQGISVNAAMLAPHGMIREAAMGHKEGRPSSAEMEAMKAMLRGAMEDGAFGMSTGLAYPPGYNSDTDELIELMRVCREYGGIYFSHIRNEADGVLEAVGEAIRVGEEAGVPVQISHVKAFGSPNYGKVREVLALIGQARSRGLDVTGDVYPYIASSTSLSAIMLPPSVLESGDMKSVMSSLRDPEERRKVREFAEGRMLSMAPKEGVYKLIPDALMVRLIKWILADSNMVEGVYGHPEYDGKTFKQIKKMRGFRGDILDMGLEILAESQHDITIISFMMSEADVRTALESPYIMIGSDGMGIASRGQHPRSFGTFPRVLGHYAREEGLLTLEQAVHKMTGMAAKKLGLEDRGVIEEGAIADLVLFNPETVIDRATFEKTKERPEGIIMVLVNGAVTVDNGRHTGARAGRVLRKTGQ